jgi:hypothetical protein
LPLRRWSDHWFELLKKKVHPLLELQAGEQPSILYNGILRRRGPVRIAILDIGVDLPVPPCEEFQDKIVGYQDWVDPGNETQQDLDGHGTHSTALLMKVAPNADIYIERVFERGDHRKGNFQLKISTMVLSRFDSLVSILEKSEINQIIRPFGMRSTLGMWTSSRCPLDLIYRF